MEEDRTGASPTAQTQVKGRIRVRCRPCAVQSEERPELGLYSSSKNEAHCLTGSWVCSTEQNSNPDLTWHPKLLASLTARDLLWAPRKEESKLREERKS